MCEQLGEEPNPELLPPDPSEFSVLASKALILLDILPDNWEGFGGNWLGKNYSGLIDIMDICEITKEERKDVLELLKVCENELFKLYANKKKNEQRMKR